MRRRVLASLTNAFAYIAFPGLKKSFELALIKEGIKGDDELDWIREAIAIHELWAERLKDPASTFTFREGDGPEFVMSARVLKTIVGNVAHHKKWADRYRQMLESRITSHLGKHLHEAGGKG